MQHQNDDRRDARGGRSCARRSCWIRRWCRVSASYDHPDCGEGSAHRAAPDSEYGWEKFFGERLCRACARNYGIAARTARLHNIFGPEGSWSGGREKVPAALGRKVAMAPPGGEIEIRGDGAQTRSFLCIDECLDGVLRLLRSDCAEPLNIGSEEILTIDQLAHTIIDIAGKRVTIRHIAGPLGVRGRTSDNGLIRTQLGGASPPARGARADLSVDRRPGAVGNAGPRRRLITPPLPACPESDSRLVGSGDIPFSQVGNMKSESGVASPGRGDGSREQSSCLSATVHVHR